MSGLAMSSPWVRLTADAIAAVPAQLGVFQIADKDHTIIRIGYAGGREPFGMRSALDAALDQAPTSETYFRVELTHSYLTRWEELLMVHNAMHGQLPDGNRDHPHRLGVLTIDDSATH
jgi:hypothetical protein